MRFRATLFVLIVTALTAGGARSEPLVDQIVVGPGPTWLIRHGGGPLFLCGPGDPEGFLYRGTRQPDGTRAGDQTALIDKLDGTGANCIYLMAVRSHGGDGGSTENPFVDSDPSLGLDDDVLDQWESWFTAMDDAGIVIYFFFYDDSARVWNTGDGVGQAERDFVRALVDRFEHHPLLIWCVAEEYSESYSPARVSNLAQEIRAADDHDHVVAVHQHSGVSFDFADDPTIDQFAIQYNVSSAAQLHSGMVSAWNQASGRYQLTMSEAAEWGTGTEARQKSWAVALGGAYVMVLGMDIASTPLSDLQDCGRLVSFMESTAFPQMAPRDELAFGDTQYVLADPPNAYIAYTPSLSGEIGLRGISEGEYDFRWLDCVTGTTVVQSAVPLLDGDQTWSTPGGLGAEVAVSIEASPPVALGSQTWTNVKARYRDR